MKTLRDHLIELSDAVDAKDRENAKLCENLADATIEKMAMATSISELRDQLVELRTLLHEELRRNERLQIRFAQVGWAHAEASKDMPAPETLKPIPANNNDDRSAATYNMRDKGVTAPAETIERPFAPTMPKSLNGISSDGQNIYLPSEGMSEWECQNFYAEVYGAIDKIPTNWRERPCIPLEHIPNKLLVRYGINFGGSHADGSH